MGWNFYRGQYMRIFVSNVNAHQKVPFTEDGQMDSSFNTNHPPLHTQYQREKLVIKMAAMGLRLEGRERLNEMYFLSP